MPRMSPLEVARIALQVWPTQTAIMMVAIAGLESGWNTDAGGDSPAALRRAGRYDTARLAEKFNCPRGDPNGPASWGLWQIFMPVHREKLRALGAPADDSCALAAWLRNPYNNARAADAVLKSQGPRAWTAFKTGAWKTKEAEAAQAVSQAQKAPLPLVPGRTLSLVGILAVGAVIHPKGRAFLKEKISLLFNRLKRFRRR